MIDDLLRPIGPGPRPPTDGFVLALHAGRQRRWRTVRINAAAATAALVVALAAVMPRLTTTTFAGLEPTRPVIGTHPVPQPTTGESPAPSATPTPDVRDPEIPSGDDPAGPAGHAPGGYAPAAPRGPAGPRAEGSMGPAEPDSAPAEPYSEPAQQPPAEEPPPAESPSPEPAPPPAPPPATDPGPEPVDLTYEDQPVNAPCQGSTWCWSAQVVGSYTFKLKACRGASDTSGVLNFSRENEADFKVMQNGVEVWQWSFGQTDEEYVHPQFVDRWKCAVWSTRWYGFDQGGDPVPAGSYRLDATSLATSVPPKWWSASFTVT